MHRSASVHIQCIDRLPLAYNATIGSKAIKKNTEKLLKWWQSKQSTCNCHFLPNFFRAISYLKQYYHIFHLLILANTWKYNIILVSCWYTCTEYKPSVSLRPNYLWFSQEIATPPLHPSNWYSSTRSWTRNKITYPN